MTPQRLTEAARQAVARRPRRPARFQCTDECSMRADLPAELESVPAARHALCDHLTHWGLGLLAETLALPVNELLANAVIHGCAGREESGTITLTACRTPAELRIGVEDPSPEQPHIQKVIGDAESGRGLLLVDELCDRWGVTPTADGTGKQVWLAMDLSQRAVPPGT